MWSAAVSTVLFDMSNSKTGSMESRTRRRINSCSSMKICRLSYCDRVARNFEAFGARGFKGIRRAREQDNVKAKRGEAFFKPAEVVILVVGFELIGAGGDVKAVNDPRVIALQFKQARPGGVGFHRQRFLLRLKVDRAAPPGKVGEGAPFRRNERRVIFVFARSHDARMLVERKGDVGFERQARAFEDDFWGKFAHGGIISLRYIQPRHFAEAILTILAKNRTFLPPKNSDKILKRIPTIVVVYSRSTGNLMDDKITIIEGPTPIFEHVNDGWAMGLNEGPRLSVPALTRLRTFNGPALVQRCYTAWHNKSSIHLHYRHETGLEETAPILAARNVETPDGHVLLLWVYLDSDGVEYEMDSGDDDQQDDFPDA